MNKKEVAAALEEIARLMELQGENPFKTRSYTNVARTIEQLQEDLGAMVAEKRLRELKGVGEALEQKIEELVTTGRLVFLEKLRAQFPQTLFELFAIPGLGPKRIKALYEELGIDSIDKLEQACSAGTLSQLKGFSDKIQHKILEGIAFSRRHAGRHHFNLAERAAEAITSHLLEHGPVRQLSVAGSLRRKKEVVKDVDIVASSDEPAALMDCFVKAPGVASITGHGETKSSVVLESGIAVDLRVVADAQFPFALAHFTGSKEHNVVMRQRAKERGLKLNEYGLFGKDDSPTPCDDETAIFAALDLPYVPPELREDRGEFTADLPDLIEAEDLIGVIHCHSTYSDGAHTLAEMGDAARALGYQYLVISDHSQSAVYAGGLRPEDIARQQAEIAAYNGKQDGFRILSGIESDIRTDGNLDYDDDVLANLDIVIASVHMKLSMDEEEATARLVRAIEHSHTHIIGHPTGRLLLTREGYPLDMERIFDACAANGVAVEINANCLRLDCDWRHLQRGKEKGVKFAIGPDAHHTDGLAHMKYGLGIARKGWLERDDVLNSLSAEELLAWRR